MVRLNIAADQRANNALYRFLDSRIVRGGWAATRAAAPRIMNLINRIGARNILKIAAGFASGGGLAAVLAAVESWITAEANKPVDTPRTSGGGNSNPNSSITPHSPNEMTKPPPAMPNKSAPGMPPDATPSVESHVRSGSRLLMSMDDLGPPDGNINYKSPDLGIRSGTVTSEDMLNPWSTYNTPSEKPKDKSFPGSLERIGKEFSGAGADVWDFIYTGGAWTPVPTRTETGKFLTENTLLGEGIFNGDFLTAPLDRSGDAWVPVTPGPPPLAPGNKTLWGSGEGNFEFDETTGSNVVEYDVEDPVDEMEPDWEDLRMRVMGEVAKETGGTRRSAKSAWSMNGSVKNVAAPFAPLGIGDSANAKSTPIFPPNDVTDLELEYRKGILGASTFEGDMLSEKKNDPRARKLQTSIKTLTFVEGADIFHPNLYYEPVVNPKSAYSGWAKHRVKTIDDAIQGYAWEWQDPTLRVNNRDPEVFVGFTYDTSNNPTLPAQLDVYTVSDTVPRPYTPTEPRMGPQLYDAPQLVGVGFDERNPPPDPFTTTHSTSSVVSTTGAGLAVTGESKKRNIDELDKNSNPMPVASIPGNRAQNPPSQPTLGKVQRRRRDTYNAANQTNPWSLATNPVAPTESIPANIGKSM